VRTMRYRRTSAQHLIMTHVLFSPAMKVIYHTLATLPEPPIRFPLGKDAISGFRSQAKAYAEDASKYESLSDDLMLEDGVPTHLF
jgi:hypothetical protein